jgi:hypothetical protein
VATPTKQLRLAGRPGGNGRAKALDTADAIGAFDIPPSLPAPEKRIVSDMIDCIPAGVIGRIDSAAVEMMLKYHVVWRKAMKDWMDDPSDREARISATYAGDRFARIATSLGMTPSGRAGLPAPEAGDDELQALVGLLTDA